MAGQGGEEEFGHALHTAGAGGQSNRKGNLSSGTGAVWSLQGAGSSMSARDYQELTRLLSTGPLPPSNCVSYKQSLTSEQVKEVAALVEGHATLRGLRLKGCGIDADGADVSW